MKPLKEKISITLDNDLVERLKIEAENDDRSLSQYINIILKEHIKKLDTQNGSQINNISGNINNINIKN